MVMSYCLLFTCRTQNFVEIHVKLLSYINKALQACIHVPVHAWKHNGSWKRTRYKDRIKYGNLQNVLLKKGKTSEVLKLADKHKVIITLVKLEHTAI